MDLKPREAWPGSPRTTLHRVEEEIQHAKAEALGHGGERLTSLLMRLAELDRRLRASRDAARGVGADRPLLKAEIEARNRVRDEAASLVHHLIIQREALGLVRHALVHERFRSPRDTTHGPRRS